MMAESQPQMAGGTVESRDERYLFPMLGATALVLLTNNRIAFTNRTMA